MKKSRQVEYISKYLIIFKDCSGTWGSNDPYDLYAIANTVSHLLAILTYDEDLINNNEATILSALVAKLTIATEEIANDLNRDKTITPEVIAQTLTVFEEINTYVQELHSKKLAEQNPLLFIKEPQGQGKQYSS